MSICIRLWPAEPFLLQSTKRKKKSCQSYPSSRFPFFPSYTPMRGGSLIPPDFTRRYEQDPPSGFSICHIRPKAGVLALCPSLRFLLLALHLCTGPNSPLVKGEYSGLPEGGGLVPANPNSKNHLPKTNISKILTYNF